jgi:hypothetical protein
LKAGSSAGWVPRPSSFPLRGESAREAAPLESGLLQGGVPSPLGLLRRGAKQEERPAPLSRRKKGSREAGPPKGNRELHFFAKDARSKERRVKQKTKVVFMVSCLCLIFDDVFSLYLVFYVSRRKRRPRKIRGKQRTVKDQSPTVKNKLIKNSKKINNKIYKLKKKK